MRKLLLISFLCVACKWNVNEITHSEKLETERTPATISSQSDSFQNKSKWKIYGTEPFWHIDVNGDTVIYSRLNEQIDTVFFRVDAISGASDRTNFIYSCLQVNSNASAKLTITKGECSDGMSDKKYFYSAQFQYGAESLNGCADKW